VKRLVAGIGAAAFLALSAPATAQDEPAVRLILTKQTSFATPDRPLRISVAVDNGSDQPLTRLTQTVAVNGPVPSRSDYDLALEGDPLSALVARTDPVDGSVGPGAFRRLPAMTLELPDLAALGPNALYPVTVELQSQGLPVATLRTGFVFITEEPVAPLLVSTSFVLDAPIRLRPDGALLDDDLEGQIAPNGRLDAIVGALTDVPGVELTLVVSPVLLEQLQQMRDGYRRVTPNGVEEVAAEDPMAVAAGSVLDRLRELTRRPGTEVVALPYASPSVPALVHAGLEEDLGRQLERGRQVVAALTGVEPSATVFRPPFSAVTASSLVPLASALGSQLGSTPALLIDGDVLPPPPPEPLTPPATAEMAIDGTTVPAVVADPGVEARTQAVPDDPILRAQWTLGELSAIYFEEPSSSRGAALIFGEGDAPERGYLRTLLRGIRGAPEATWLQGVTASRLHLGADQPAPDRRQLTATVRPSPLAATFTAQMVDSRAAVDALASMAEQPELVGELDRLLLLSESRYLSRHEDLRFEYLDAARAAVAAELDKVHLPASSSITLTSRTGRIPVTLRNDAGYPVQLQISLRAPGLELIGGATRDIVLARPIQTFVFPARTQRTGRFPVTVLLGTPNGTPIADTEIVVRSTAYNRIALLITIGAAVFLAAWWGRRLLSRTKS
jgi:Family of unknown function (DUF6049)